ncbi:MAG: hypothetical protein JWQ83_212, partial [Lacunisphaera sp.]|nr:hypothetical protein [Lacunisphaera sp.]
MQPRFLRIGPWSNGASGLNEVIWGTEGSKNQNMKMKPIISSLLIVCAATLTGCSTFNSRAEGKAAV